MCFSNTTTYTNAKKITDSLNATIPKAVKNIKGYYRYLTHQDNPEKAQYSEVDIITLNGFNKLDYFDITRNEILSIKRQVKAFIVEHNINEYCDLLDYLDEANLPELLDCAMSNTILFNTYLKSKRHK